MVRTQHPHEVGQQLFEGVCGTGRIPRLAPPLGERVAGGEGAGVVRAQHPYPVGQHIGKAGGRTGRIPRPAPPAGEVVAGGKGVGVVGAKVVVDGGGQVLEIVAGDGGLAALAEAGAGPIQHPVCVGPVQGVFGAAR